MKRIYVFTALLLMVSCSQKESNDDMAAIDSRSNVVVATIDSTPSNNIISIDSIINAARITQSLIGAYNSNLNTIKASCDSNTIDDSIHGVYSFLLDSIIENVSNINSNLIVKLGNCGGNVDVLSQSEMKRYNSISNNGLMIKYIGEGYSEIYPDNAYLYKQFEGCLNAELRSLFEIIIHEDSSLYSADAGILVPVSEIANRINALETFLQDYPQSKHVPNIKQKRDSYLHDLLIGQDNTPAFDDSIINEEFLRVYEDYASTAVNGYAKDVVNKYLETLKENNLKNSDACRSLLPEVDYSQEFRF